jgi:UDP-N-acetylmuramoyl-tripeptide--D-alanyl-D-alanine ligase
MSVSFDTLEAATWCGARISGSDANPSYSSVSIDSRTIQADALFVAIRGPHHDGHGFIDAAIAAGSKGVLVESGHAPDLGDPGVPVLGVEDTTRALGELARGHRRGFEGPLIGITGSSGKTTTKDLCAAALGAERSCLRTRGNLNNEFGVPLTLLSREPEHRVAVIELGMNHRGEIARLAEIAEPSIGLITNIGTAHIEFLGSAEAIADEKGDLFAALPADGIAVVNLEDPAVVAQAERSPARKLGYGFSPKADVRARLPRFEAAPEPTLHFDLECESGRAEIAVRGLSDTTILNALAAAAGALAVGASLESIVRGLGSYRPAAGRMNPLRGRDGSTVIDDSYNSNPQSLAAALATLADRSGPARRIAVLGDMNELGERAIEEHRRAGRLCVESAVDQIYALGRHAGEVVDAAIEAGMPADRAHASEDLCETVAALEKNLSSGDWILVKGSRGSRMERVVEQLAPEAKR